MIVHLFYFEEEGMLYCKHGRIYSCFEKGCPTEKHKSVRDNTERHDGLWLFTVASSSSRVFSAMEGGAMKTSLRVLKETKWILSF